MNPNDIPTQEFHGVPESAEPYLPSRRDFLKGLASGLVIWVALKDSSLFGAEESEAAKAFSVRPRVPTDFNAFLRIGEDGRVTCFTGKIEMGQGPITSLPQMLAEDLEVPLESVDIIMGDTDLCPFDAGTWGSLSTRAFGPLLRLAATEAKCVLLELAAEALHTPVAQLVAKDGAIHERDNPARKITYAALTKGKKIERHLDAKPTLKQVADFTISGKPLLRRDSREKVTGKAQYTGDIRLPGMLYAKILRPPEHGAKLRKADLSAARTLPGVLVVEEGDFIAVLHELPDLAEEALDKIKADFAPSPLTHDDKTIFDHLGNTTLAPKVMSKGGDLAEGERLSQKKFRSVFLNSYVAHSAMEPHTALARVEGDKATIWASTQNPFGVRDEIARTLGLPLLNVRVITPFVGGGFGGKSSNSQAVEAARLAKAVGRPVQVMWSREEEFFNDTFRPAAVVKIHSGIDASGNITLWDYNVMFAGDRGSPHNYTIPNHRTSAVGAFNGPAGYHPFAVGAWRAPGCNTNAFARESQIDMMAVAAGIDPIEFRLRHLSEPRMIRVVKAVAERFGWTPIKGPSGRGLGVACGTDAGSFVASIAEIEVDRATGAVVVKRVVCAQEMGVVVNPAGAKLQMEGCITMGLGYALSEEIHFKGGNILDTNFNSYTIPRFSWVPKMDTVILEANDIPPQGGGEPAIILMGGLLANAIFDATGARLMQLPMTPARVKEAMAAADKGRT